MARDWLLFLPQRNSFGQFVLFWEVDKHTLQTVVVQQIKFELAKKATSSDVMAEK